MSKSQLLKSGDHLLYLFCSFVALSNIYIAEYKRSLLLLSLPADFRMNHLLQSDSTCESYGVNHSRCCAVTTFVVILNNNLVGQILCTELTYTRRKTIRLTERIQNLRRERLIIFIKYT